MFKKLCLLFAIAILFTFSACENPVDAEKKISSENILSDTSSTDDVPVLPIITPTFQVVCSNLEEYEIFFKNENFSVPLLSAPQINSLGMLSFFSLKYYDENFRVEYHFSYNGVMIELIIGRKTPVSDSFYNVVMIEEEDMPENLEMNPQEHWLRLSADERDYQEYMEKYSAIDSQNSQLGYKINENIYLRYVRDLNPVCLFYFEDYTIVLEYGIESDRGSDGNIASYPTLKSLLTKSTSKEAAEELYNLWKDALK